MMVAMIVLYYRSILLYYCRANFFFLDFWSLSGGLSLERPTMIKYRIDNIRNLFGHKVDMGMTKNAPICRFEMADEEDGAKVSSIL